MSKRSFRVGLVGALAGACAVSSGLAADRVILMEDFNATWCVYCPPVSEECGVIMDANPERYIVLQTHLSDAYPSTWGNTRGNYFAVTGLPTTVQDGVLRRVGQYSAGTYTNDYNSRRSVSTNVTLDIASRHVSGGSFNFDITAAVEPGTPARTMRVQFVQVLDDYPYVLPEWRNCVMSGITAPQTITVQPGESATVTYPMTISGASWSPITRRPNIKVVAFVQANGNYPGGSEVYQAAQLRWTQILPTDAQGDGDVDLSDLAIVLANFGTQEGATQSQGDSDSDGDIDLQDLATLLADFGT